MLHPVNINLQKSSDIKDHHQEKGRPPFTQDPPAIAYLSSFDGGGAVYTPSTLCDVVYLRISQNTVCASVCMTDAHIASQDIMLHKITQIIIYAVISYYNAMEWHEFAMSDVFDRVSRPYTIYVHVIYKFCTPFPQSLILSYMYLFLHTYNPFSLA